MFLLKGDSELISPLYPSLQYQYTDAFRLQDSLLGLEVSVRRP